MFTLVNINLELKSALRTKYLFCRTLLYLLILLHHRIMMIGHLEESHEEEELENSEDREVKVQVDWHPVPHYLINIWSFVILFQNI